MPRAKKADGPKAAPKKAPAKGHPLAKPLPVGTKLTDFKKNEWVLGPHIGQGGFGLIYAARRASEEAGDERHVVKIEPKSNGPLFCEIHFYHKVQLDQVSSWIKKKHLKSLGLPTEVFNGHHEVGSTEYRFLVMERYGEDLQKLFERNGRRFPAVTALSVALRVIDVLEFIHSSGYVHADIKAANLLLGLPPKQNEVFLVDFGLAFRFSRDGLAMPYKEDPRRRHDGTLEFCSLDAHRGASPAPRGDFQTLAFCVLQWLGGQLPWDPLLGSSKEAMERVFRKKEEGMADVKALAASCEAAGMPDFVKFLQAVSALSYEEKIDYDRMRGFLQSALRQLGANPQSQQLSFAAAQPKVSSTKAAGRKRPQVNGDSNAKSPAARAKSPAVRIKSPAARAKSPAARAKSPTARAKSPTARAKSPTAGAKSPTARTKSPTAGAKSPAVRAKSPAARAKSPALNAKSSAAPKSPSPLTLGPSAQKRARVTSPASGPRNASSQTSPALLQALREQRRQRRQRKS